MAVLSGSTLPSRRGFLSSLIALPFFGGGLSLAGAPYAAAVPPTRELLRRYQAWLYRENLAVLAQIRVVDGTAPACVDLARLETYWPHVPMCLIGEDAEAEALIASAPPSTRAAVVMAAAGMAVAA